MSIVMPKPPIVVHTPPGHRKAAANRKKALTLAVSTLSPGSEFTDEELQFLQALQHFKKENRRYFPTFTEVLAVARQLGYRRVAPAEPPYDRFVREPGAE